MRDVWFDYNPINFTIDRLFNLEFIDDQHIERLHPKYLSAALNSGYYHMWFL